MSAALSGLSIGSLSLTPAFSPEVTAYTAGTTNSTNTVTAVPEDSAATVNLEVNGAPLPNGTPASWNDGENTVAVQVSNGDERRVYTAAVTKA